MLCDVIFSFFTLNTSFFDFAAERQIGKIKLEGSVRLLESMREILGFGSCTESEQRWRKREGESEGPDPQKTPFTPRLWEALHLALVGPTRCSVDQGEIVWCRWIPSLDFPSLCLSSPSG